MPFSLKMTEQQFAAMKQKAGIRPDAKTGHVEHSGVRADWKWDPVASQVDVNVTHKPMLISEGLIETKFREWAGV